MITGQIAIRAMSVDGVWASIQVVCTINLKNVSKFSGYKQDNAGDHVAQDHVQRINPEERQI